MDEFERASIEVLEEREDFAQLSMRPLEKGYGTTLGNALRRVLLSFIPGSAVTALQIEGVEIEGERRGDPHHVLHEFSTIPGVLEDVTDLVLNFKNLIVRSRSTETKILYLEAKGGKEDNAREVYGRDIEPDAEVDILNPDLHLLTLDGGLSEVHIQIYVDQGMGFLSAEFNKKANFPIGVIPIDSFFSPVRQVSYRIVPTRVGRAIEDDCLEMSIWTNRSIGPLDALVAAAEILVDRFSIIMNLRSTFTPLFPSSGALETPLEALHLSVRPFNALKSIGVVVVGDLVLKTESELKSIKNFGKSSLDVVRQKLDELGLHLKGEE
ncbi:MAG: DNA-directed RNA polymerase subunit alpha [Coprothermobacterota bacterium]|nr:DNA-directed RNA polymerase subunit alpha [Coprothermobacterota bacterium]